MPDEATIAAARPCCPECGAKLTRSQPDWIVRPSPTLWYCTDDGQHRQRTWPEDTIAARLVEVAA